MTNVVVTGGTGFIGSHLVERLIEKGYNVRCPVRRTSNLRWLEGKDVEIIRVDFFDVDSLVPVFKNADYVYHIAGVTKARNYREYYLGNVKVTENIINACLKLDSVPKRFVFASSQSAVGPGFNSTPVDETYPYKPITSYGKSKAEAEKLVLKHSDKIPVTVVRPSAVYGPRDTYTFEIFKYVKYGFLPVVLSGDWILSIVYVDDLVEGFILAGESDVSVGKVYFISSEKIYRWAEVESVILRSVGRKVLRLKVSAPVLYFFAFVSEFFYRLKGKPAPLNIEKAREIRQRNWACSVEKAVRELGYKQKVELEDGMKKTIEWYKNNGWL